MANDLVSRLLGGITPMAQQAPQQLMGAPQTAPADLSQGAVPPAFTQTQMVQKHGLGNILSIMGDIVLANSGLQPQYLPRLQAAKEADAVQGIEQDPMAAIHRLWSINPQQAQKLYDALPAHAYTQALTQSTQDADARNEALAPIMQNLQREKLFAPAASMAMAATNDKTGKSWPAVSARINSYLTARGMQDHLAGLPSTFDPAGIKQWASGAITPDKQVDDTRAQEAQDDLQDYRGKELGLRAEEVGNQSRSIDDQIGFRAWQKQHGDFTSQSEDNYKKWLMAHPPKTRRDGTQSAPPPPRRVGDKIKSADGTTLTSLDGKTWSK